MKILQCEERTIMSNIHGEFVDAPLCMSLVTFSFDRSRTTFHCLSTQMSIQVTSNAIRHGLVMRYKYYNMKTNVTPFKIRVSVI
ncbi:hypothetical protein HanIR_Chr12g0563761 [Helianthus annuus]|nr:hypothetical protein HanIR_Chr12g0563761 [Helianthus annuus]